MCVRVKSLICWILVAVSLTNAAATNPNILFIVVDDLRPTLGCYGDQKAISPNIDSLASKGITFTNAYCQQAICGPSRTSFLTSRRPDTTHLYDFYSYWRVAAGNFTTIPQFFKERGYHSVSVGKVFHPGKASNFTDDYPYSWSIPAYHPSSEKYKMAKVCPGPDGSLHMNLVCPVDVLSQPEKTLPDLQNAAYAVDFINSWAKLSGNDSKPFFLAVGFHKPHVPLKYPKEYLNLYPIQSMDLAPDRWRPEDLPDVAWNPWTDLREREDVQALNVSFPYGPLPDEFQLYVRQSYYAATSYMDDQVGKVLKALEKNGFAHDTVIVLLGDHGWALGEHQEWSKYSNYEVALKIPLIFYVPGLTNPFQDGVKSTIFNRVSPLTKSVKFQKKQVPSQVGTRYDQHGIETNALVELVDIFPTLVELAGYEPMTVCPKNSSGVELCTEGASLLPLIKHAVLTGKYKMANMWPSSRVKPLKWKSAIFSQYPRPSLIPQNDSDKPLLKHIKIMGYTMKTKAHHYTEWIGFDPKTFRGNWSQVYARELYIYPSDYREDFNMAMKPQYSKIIRKLSKQLRKGWRYFLPKN